MSRIKDFLLTVLVTLSFYVTVGSSEVTKESKNCTAPLVFNVSQAGSGSFVVDFEEKCDIYIYQIKCLTKSSIIKLKSIYTYHNNLTNSKDADPRQIKVVLKEFTNLKDGKKSLIAVNEWNIHSKDAIETQNKLFFSRTSDLTVYVTKKGKWSQEDFDLAFSYEEVEFQEYRKSSKDREGEVSPWISVEGRGYRPNSVYVFQIMKSDDITANNIDLELKKLQIDDGIGEYLLVGAGKDVFQGPPPLFLSSLQSKKRVKIFDDNAYIVLVAASTRYNYSGFQITWKYNGTRIDRKEDKIDEEKIRQISEESSMPICIFNSSAALDELNKQDSFRKFREKLASLATEYYPMVYEGKRLNIDASQVRIVRVSGFVKENKEEGLYVMVNIQHKDGKAVFDWEKMGHILQKYSSLSNSSVLHGYRIRECPKKTTPQSKWPLYLIAPIICCLFILIWNWKNTPFSKIFSKKIKKVIGRSRQVQMVQVGENEFVSNPEINAVPKLLITNDEGRRYTWNNDDDILSSGPEQDSDIEVFNKMDLKRSNSSRSSPGDLRSARSSTRSTMKPEINAAYEKDEDEIQNTPEASASTSNNIYDSLNSQKSLLSRYVTDETKL